MEKTWIKTDDFQFVSKEDEQVFEVINVSKWEDGGGYLGAISRIDLRDYNECDIQGVVNTYGYRDICDLEDTYREISNQVLAECIIELEFFENDSEIYKDINEVNKWLQEITTDKSVYIQ